MSKHRITKVWVDDTHVYAMTETGLTANYAFSKWPKLAKATREQREEYRPLCNARPPSLSTMLKSGVVLF